MTDGSTSGTDRCPNCQQKGYPDIAASESGADYHTWQCSNSNCRVARYYVEPGNEQPEGER